MWVSRPLFSECERWKYILKTFFCHLFWKWQWPIYVGCISLCILSSMSFYWMLQCHHVLLLSTCSCFRTIFNRKKLLFSVSLFLFPKEDCVCRKTSNAEALLLIMKDIKNRVVGRRKEKKKSTQSHLCWYWSPSYLPNFYHFNHFPITSKYVTMLLALPSTIWLYHRH